MTRKTPLIAFALCWAAFGGHPAVAAESPPTDPIQLTVGQPAFWYGGQIDDTKVADPSLCGTAGPCPTFELVVPAAGSRLRVAYDTPFRTNTFGLELTAPDGATTSTTGSNVFDAEALVEDPEAGTWTVRVVPEDVTHGFFRMRAKLEGAPPATPATPVPLLPNLKAVPPYEFGFVAPANPLNAAYPPDTVNPPLSAGGVEPLSCTADESAPEELGGGGATECLRLTSGPINVGNGPFIKTFTFASDASNGGLSADGAYIYGHSKQVVVFSDGSTQTRPGGTYAFHTTHGHFHDEGILTYELFRVDGRDLVPAGNGTKSGFCPADQLMGEWRSFTQDPPGDYGTGDTATGSCYGAADDGMIALTRGWGDVYRWQRPGQYVEFSGNGNGLYVARTTVDKGDTTLETNEKDNSSYALIRVNGHQVDELERGQGLSPFDPHKVVFTGYGPASQDPYGALPPSAPEPGGGGGGGGGGAPGPGASGGNAGATKTTKKCGKHRKLKRGRCEKPKRRRRDAARWVRSLAPPGRPTLVCLVGQKHRWLPSAHNPTPWSGPFRRSRGPGGGGPAV
jgi:hypothetical protein